MKKKSWVWSGNFRRISFILLIVLIWEGAFRLGLWEEYLFPAPSSVCRSLVEGVRNHSFLVGIMTSLRRIVVGYAASLAGGILIGLLIGTSRLAHETVGSLVVGLQTIPSICWLPLAILWFGLGEGAILFVVIMGAILSIAIATEAGVNNTPPIYLRAAKMMGAKRARIYCDVILPSALPSIITGMKQGWTFAWRSLMAGELLFVSLGLGHLLQVGRELNDMSQVVAVMVVIVVIGLFFDQFVFLKLEREVRRRWGLGERTWER